jgi:hypothetical protein
VIGQCPRRRSAPSAVAGLAAQSARARTAIRTAVSAGGGQRRRRRLSCPAALTERRAGPPQLLVPAPPDKALEVEVDLGPPWLARVALAAPEIGIDATRPDDNALPPTSCEFLSARLKAGAPETAHVDQDIRRAFGGVSSVTYAHTYAASPSSCICGISEACFAACISSKLAPWQCRHVGKRRPLMTVTSCSSAACSTSWVIR